MWNYCHCARSFLRYVCLLNIIYTFNYQIKSYVTCWWNAISGITSPVMIYLREIHISSLSSSSSGQQWPIFYTSLPWQAIMIYLFVKAKVGLDRYPLPQPEADIRDWKAIPESLKLSQNPTDMESLGQAIRKIWNVVQGYWTGVLKFIRHVSNVF